MGEQMSEAMSEARPMSLDLGSGPISLDLGNMPSSPSLGLPMWTPPADGLNMWAQSNNLVITPPAVAPPKVSFELRV